MMLSPHFSLEELTRSETAKARGIRNTPEQEHLLNLVVTAHRMEVVRAILGRPIVPTSGYRSPTLNRAVGGVPTSDHALGWAVDFAGTIHEAQHLVETLDSWDQLILERNGQIIHVSFNPRSRRQVLTQKGGPGTAIQQGLVS